MDRNELKRIYREFNLTENDIFVMTRGGNKIPIITRSGIEKIQAKKQLVVSFSAEQLSPSFVVIKAKCGDIETYGEASSANTTNAYPVAIAEKRAKSRAILQAIGLYKDGYFGEDEFTDDEEEDNDISPDLLLQMLSTSSFEGKKRDQLYFDCQNIKNQNDYKKMYFLLQDAQIDPLNAPGTRMSQTDVKEQLKKQGL